MRAELMNGNRYREKEIKPRVTTEVGAAGCGI